MTDFKPRMLEVAKRDQIESLIKGIEVIQAFNESLPRMTVSEIAERVGLSRAAARRYLLTLIHLGLAMQEGRYFRLAQKGMNLAFQINKSVPVPAPAQSNAGNASSGLSLLERLTPHLSDTGTLAVLILDGSDRVPAGIAAALPPH